jgi:hypothetical protein
VPAPQDGYTPADFERVRGLATARGPCAKFKALFASGLELGNAEVKALFTSGQVRPIRVQSEVIRGHSEATQRPSETLSCHQRRSKGSQEHSEAIGGQSETILGNQAHSVALSGNREGAGTHDGYDGHIAC